MPCEQCGRCDLALDYTVRSDALFMRVCFFCAIAAWATQQECGPLAHGQIEIGVVQ